MITFCRTEENKEKHAQKQSLKKKNKNKKIKTKTKPISSSPSDEGNCKSLTNTCVFYYHSHWCCYSDWSVREGPETPSYSADVELLQLRWDFNPERGALDAMEIPHHWVVVLTGALWERGQEENCSWMIFIFIFRLSVVVLNSGWWCPSSGADRPSSVWNWESWWGSWWSLVRGRFMRWRSRGHPAMEDLTSILFWTSEFCCCFTSQERKFYSEFSLMPQVWTSYRQID